VKYSWSEGIVWSRLGLPRQPISPLAASGLTERASGEGSGELKRRTTRAHILVGDGCCDLMDDNVGTTNIQIQCLLEEIAVLLQQQLS